MRLGFNEATCMKRSTVEQDLILCEKYSYDYIELRLDMLKEYFSRGNKLRDLQSFFSSSRLKPLALNSIENINFCDQRQWKDMTELFTFACELCQAIDNPYIIVVSTMGDDMCLKNEKEVFDNSVDTLRNLADIARPYKAKLAFEPIGDQRWCVRSLDQALSIVQETRLPEVGLALDAINLYMFNRLRDINIIDKTPLEKIFVYHINDCEDLELGVLDHCHRLYPGDGVIPLPSISAKLKAKGYDGSCSVELFRPEYWSLNPEEVIRVAAEKTRAFL